MKKEEEEEEEEEEKEKRLIHLHMTERKIQVMGEGEGRGEREKLMKRSRSETQNWWSRDRRDNEWRQRRLSGDVTRVEIPTTPGFSARILRQDSPPGFSARILDPKNGSHWLLLIYRGLSAFPLS